MVGADNPLHSFLSSLSLCRFIVPQNWRRDNNVDSILQTFPLSPYFRTLMNYWPSTYVGTFHAGYKVFYERLGYVEVKNLLRAVPLDALVSYHIYILESQEREYVLCLPDVLFDYTPRVMRKRCYFDSIQKSES